MKTPLKIGDKVCAYWTMDASDDKPEEIRTVGIVTNMDEMTLQMKVIDDGAGDAYFTPGSKVPWHVRQCRRLVRKERDRVWVCFHLRHNSPIRVTRDKVYYEQSFIGEEWREFIEVKKK